MSAIIDYHMHTNYSGDAVMVIPEVFEKASKFDKAFLCITQHYEPSTFASDFVNSILTEQLDEYFKKVEKLNQEYGLNIRIGLEAEYDEDYENVLRKNIENYPFDFILGSTHRIKGVLVTDILQNFQKTFNLPTDKLVKAYFDKLNKAAASGLFDILSHIDVVKRNLIRLNVNPSVETYKNYITELVPIMKKNNIGFEINAAGIISSNPNRINEFYPKKEIIDMFFKAGIMKFTVGSDAHNQEKIGKTDTALKVAKEIGYGKVCVFKNRKPEFIEIEGLLNGNV